MLCRAVKSSVGPSIEQKILSVSVDDTDDDDFLKVNGYKNRPTNQPTRPSGHRIEQRLQLIPLNSCQAMSIVSGCCHIITDAFVCVAITQDQCEILLCCGRPSPLQSRYLSLSIFSLSSIWAGIYLPTTIYMPCPPPISKFIRVNVCFVRHL